MLPSTQVLRLVLMLEPANLIFPYNFPSLRCPGIGMPLRLAENWDDRLPHQGLRCLPGCRTTVVLLGIGTWGFLQVLIGPGRGDGARDQWEVTLDNPLSQPLLAGAC